MIRVAVMQGLHRWVWLGVSVKAAGWGWGSLQWAAGVWSGSPRYQEVLLAEGVVRRLHVGMGHFSAGLRILLEDLRAGLVKSVLGRKLRKGQPVVPGLWVWMGAPQCRTVGVARV